MKESDYEKLRNKLTLFRLVLETVMRDPAYVDNMKKDSFLLTAHDDLEEATEIINKLERKDK